MLPRDEISWLHVEVGEAEPRIAWRVLLGLGALPSQGASVREARGGGASRCWATEEARPESAGLEVCSECKSSEPENVGGFPRTYCVRGLPTGYTD